MSTIWDVLKAPVITEKALKLTEKSTKNIRDSKNKKTIRRDRQVLSFRVANSIEYRNLPVPGFRRSDMRTSAALVLTLRDR